ncbi:UNVERIFIED_CONTAM: UDP glycosyltransferase 9 [Sesamum angustifolium]|uniref:UDP glycosyltransferase 9 n=1 Tax=Sesamum angustifolium TaxID=2727405 RepID=A0AAW2LWD7_9LAMI
METEVAAARKLHVLVVPYPGQGHINPALEFAKYLASKEDVKDSESIEGYFNRFKTVFSKNLARFIDEQTNAAQVIVYDSTMPWVLDIAHERGLRGASFFTQSCAVSAVFYHLKQETLRFPYEDSVVSLPSLPALGTKDLPSFLEFMDSKQTIPTIISSRTLRKWIGSFSTRLTSWKMRYSRTSCYYVVRMNLGCHISSRLDGESISDQDSWTDFQCRRTRNFPTARTIRSACLSPPAQNGLIVGWCKQPEVLAHRAVACFLTHCGWNSTLEALSCGVPLIAMPQWVDQLTNSKFIEDVWGVGVRVKRGEDGIVGREEIAMCIKEVSEEDRGMELKRNACVWKDLANEAVEKGGTSANNIEDFVSKLTCIS